MKFLYGILILLLCNSSVYAMDYNIDETDEIPTAAMMQKRDMTWSKTKKLATFWPYLLVLVVVVYAAGTNITWPLLFVALIFGIIIDYFFSKEMVFKRVLKDTTSRIHMPNMSALLFWRRTTE